VRQLENLCHWLTVMTPSQMVEIADFRRSGAKSPLRVWQLAATGVRLWAQQAAIALQRGDERIMDTLTAQFERTLIVQALQHTNGRRIEAATLLGIGRNTLTRKIQELGLDNQGE